MPLGLGLCVDVQIRLSRMKLIMNGHLECRGIGAIRPVDSRWRHDRLGPHPGRDVQVGPPMGHATHERSEGHNDGQGGLASTMQANTRRGVADTE